MTRQFLPATRLASLWIAALCALLTAQRGFAAERIEERWYVLLMNQERAGHAVEREIVDEEGRTTIGSIMLFKLERLGSEITLRIETTFVEKDGRPLEMSMVQDMGLAAVTEMYRFTDEGVIQESTTGGRTTTRTHPLPEGDWLTPAQARDLVARKLAEGAETFSYAVLSPPSGLTPVTQTHRVKGRKAVEVFGKTVPAIEWIVTQSVMPNVETTEYVDRHGEVVRSELNMGAFTMTMLAADRELAMSKFDAPELMAGTLVQPNRAIDNPRAAKRAAYVLSLAQEGEIQELPSAAAQKVERLDARRLRVTVDVARAPAAPEGDVEDARYRDASTMADSDDPAIKRLARAALEGIPNDPAMQAEALRVFVHNYIQQKSLGVGFATASEVCQTREGDCSEHGVLLAALMRAAGIPSRVVSGLVYVDSFMGERQVFGFHMWAQALLPKGNGMAWVDFDATMPDDVTFDATHIAVSTSSLAEGDVVNSMAALVGLLGNLRIDVERVEH